MADRYYINATGAGFPPRSGSSWNDTSHWSTSSGGAGGASVPTSSDNVFFDSNSFAGPGGATVYWDGVVECNNFTNVNSNGQGIRIGDNGVAGSSNDSVLNIYGSVNCVDMDHFASFRCDINFKATSPQTIAMHNEEGVNQFVFINGDVVFDGVGGQWDLSFVFQCRNLTILNGYFNSSLSFLSIENFDSNNSNTRNINFGSTFIIIRVALTASLTWDISSITNLTFSAGTSTISLEFSDNSNPGTLNFYGGGLTYYNFETEGSNSSINTATLNIYDSNTFNNFLFRPNTYVYFEAGTTQTINGTLNGNSSGLTCTNISYLRSLSEGSEYTISAAAVSLFRLDVKDSRAAGSASPFTTTGIDSGGNANWNFTDPTSCGWGGILARPMYFP